MRREEHVFTCDRYCISTTHHPHRVTLNVFWLAAPSASSAALPTLVTSPRIVEKIGAANTSRKLAQTSRERIRAALRRRPGRGASVRLINISGSVTGIKCSQLVSHLVVTTKKFTQG